MLKVYTKFSYFTLRYNVKYQYQINIVADLDDPGSSISRTIFNLRFLRISESLSWNNIHESRAFSKKLFFTEKVYSEITFPTWYILVAPRKPTITYLESTKLSSTGKEPEDLSESAELMLDISEEELFLVFFLSPYIF